MGLLLLLAVLATAIHFGIFGERTRRIAWSSAQHALILGGVSFAAGFVGPIIFSPGANQGPLLGILITGPLGLMLGFVIGIVRGVRAERTRIDGE